MKTLPLACSLILTVATSALGGEAVAGDADTPRQQIVKFGDLNLDHPEGVKALFGRLSRTAATVCRQPASGPYGLWSRSGDCQQEALAKAIEDIDNSNLTAYFNDRMGKSGKGGVKVASRR